MPFDCASFCFENCFLAALSRFGLVKGPHSILENPKESLIECLSAFRPRSDIVSKIEDFQNNGNRVSAQTRNLYLQGLEIEYGRQKSLLSASSCPNISLLAGLSREFNFEIYVICGLLPLRILRNEDTGRDIDLLRFNFTNSDNPSRIVIGMVGMGIFHSIEQPSSNSNLWSVLFRRAITVNHQNFISDDASSFENSDEERELDDDLAFNNNENLVVSRDHSRDDSNHNLNANRNISSISAQEFLSENMYFDGNGANLDPSSYTSEARIDISATSREDLSNNSLNSLDQTIDVDGFYGVYEWKESSVFRGNVEVSKRPMKANERETKNFKKYLMDRNLNDQCSHYFFKVAICATNFGIIDMFYGFSVDLLQNPTVSESVLTTVVNRAFQSAKTEKCWDETNGEALHPGCRSNGFREITDSYRPIQDTLNSQIYDKIRFQCFAYHFSKLLVLELAAIGILLIEDFCFVQAVGMKFVMLSPTINGVMHSVTAIGQFFDLSRMHSSFDICFATVAQCSDSEKAVRLKQVFIKILISL